MTLRLGLDAYGTPAVSCFAEGANGGRTAIAAPSEFAIVAGAPPWRQAAAPPLQAESGSQGLRAPAPRDLWNPGGPGARPST